MTGPLARSTIITAQLLVSGWHQMIGEPTIPDAILDRIIHNAHRIELKGDRMRRQSPKPALTPNENPENITQDTQANFYAQRDALDMVA